MVRRGFMAAVGALFGVSTASAGEELERPFVVHEVRPDLERRHGKPQRLVVHHCFIYSDRDKVNWSTTSCYCYGVKEALRGSTLTRRECYRDGYLTARANYIEYAHGTCEAHA